ncbi:hypothetical protein K2X05_01590 [bacterium]|nr:hypothetical protein [bacterium]
MEKNQLNWFIAGGGVLLLAFVFWQGSSKAPEKNRVTYGEVDKIRKQEVTKSQLQRERVEVENYKQAPQINGAYHETEPSAPEENLRLEASVGAAQKDIAESDLQGMAVESLENHINQRLLSEQKAAQMNSIQKKQLADEYKKRAKAMGYAVELNDKLEVTKVQKIDTSKAPKPAPVIDVDSIEEEEY